METGSIPPNQEVQCDLTQIVQPLVREAGGDLQEIHVALAGSSKVSREGVPEVLD